LKDLSTEWEVRQQLLNFQQGKDLSETLALAYERILERINHQAESPKKLARKALTWATFATPPLTEVELRQALAVDVTMSQFEESNVATVDRINRVCCGLLRIDEGHIVQLAHYSTKEYLVKERDKWLPDAHGMIAEICITYLSFQEFSRGPFPNVEWFGSGDLDALAKSKPLFRYASSNWAHHLSHAGEEEIRRLLPKFADRSDNMRLSFQAHLVGSRRHFPDGIENTHIVSYLGSPGFVRAFAQKGLLRRGERDSRQQTAVHWAVSRKDAGAREMVETLLSLGFDVNVVDVHGLSPLHIAVRSGDLEIVQLLLDKGANTEIGNQSVTPLIDACCGGHDKIVRVLLDKGANVNVVSKLGPPLAAAILGRSEKCVAEILKDRRLKKYQRNYQYGTALNDAAFHGLPGIVKKLLKAGFDPNKTVGGPDTALQVAAAAANKFAHPKESEEVVTILLGSGANVNAPGGQFGTALEAAQSNENKELEQLLRSHDAVEVNTCELLRQNSVLMTGLDYGQSSLVPKILKGQLRHFTIAVMMNNEAVLEDYTNITVIAFKEAIRERKIKDIELLAQLALMAFEQLVALARNNMGDGDVSEGSGGGSGNSSDPGFYHLLLMPLVRSTAKASEFISFILGNHGAKRETPGVALHAANTASSKLEVLTKSAVAILTLAIELGDEDIVRLLAERWANALRHISFPGKASDRMMEVLVTCRVEEFEGFFRKNQMVEAKVRAKLGVELLAAAIKGRRADARLAQLSLNLAKIWSLALRNVVDNGYVSYEQLEMFMRELQDDITTGVDLGSLRNIERFGTACIEILVAMVADENPRTAHIMARMVVEGWQHIINHGGGPLIDKTHITDIAEEMWNLIKDKEKKSEEWNTCRAWNLGSGAIKALHVAVRYGFPDVIVRLSDRIVYYLEQASKLREAAAAQAAHDQMLKWIPQLCEVDPSPVYYFEVILALFIYAARGKYLRAKRAISRGISSIIREPSAERTLLVGHIRSVISSTERPDDAARLRVAIKALQGMIEKFPALEEIIGEPSDEAPLGEHLNSKVKSEDPLLGHLHI